MGIAKGDGGGRSELRKALSESRGFVLAIGLFSIFVNLLMLTGPLFMLQLYDRVLTSRSEATLVALIGITAFLFLAMGLLDHARGRVLARVGARFQSALDARVTGAILTQAGRSPEARDGPSTGPATWRRSSVSCPARGHSLSLMPRGRRCSLRSCSCSTGFSACLRLVRACFLPRLRS